MPGYIAWINSNGNFNVPACTSPLPSHTAPDICRSVHHVQCSAPGKLCAGLQSGSHCCLALSAQSFGLLLEAAPPCTGQGNEQAGKLLI